MSGTSADGIDAAVVDITDRRVELLAFHTYAYPPALRSAVLKLCRPQTARVDDLCHLNFALGEAFASAVARLAKRAKIPMSSIDLIGSHGQTVWHEPEGRRSGRRRIRSTLQIGEPCVIAERTGVTTVADFRPRDVAAGGEGAPLVPYADYVLLVHAGRSRAVQNLGGIANVTHLPAGCAAEQILAFDTGPGNMVVDRITERATDGRLHYDRGGRLAAGGAVVASLLAELMEHPYFRRRPPKSTGRETFGHGYADELWTRARRRRIDPPDIVATVTALTAESIADAYRRFLPAPPDEVILCGGGARNRALASMLQSCLAPARLTTTDEFGIDVDAKEAVSFAVLAAETIRARPANIPAATGASRSVVLGKIVPP